MKKAMRYILFGNVFCILNVLAVLEESYTIGLVYGIVAAILYLKALSLKSE